MTNILINNKPVATQATNMAELAAELALPEKGVAMALASRMVTRTDWEATPISEGASIVIIKAACGG